jgi:hypothetical protein
MLIKVLKDISLPIATAVPLGGEGLKENYKLPLKGVQNLCIRRCN